MYNITKNGKYVLNKVITDIGLYIPGKTGNDWINVGLIEKGAVKLVAEPKTAELIDESNYQLGYNASFEIRSHQFYSIAEFDKLKNEIAMINLHPIKTYIKDVRLNIKLDATPGANTGPVIISGSKFVENIRDIFDGNPWGSLEEPWAAPVNAVPSESGGTLGNRPPVIPSTDVQYDYILNLKDPLITFLTPGEPTSSSNITEFELTLVDAYHNPVTQAVEDLTLKRFDGNTWTDITPGDDITIEISYNGGVYKVRYTGDGEEAVNFKLGDTVRVNFNYASFEE